MVDNDDSERFDELWADIPDPLVSRPAPRDGPVPGPSTASLTRREIHGRRLFALAVCVLWPVAVLRVVGTRQGIEDALTFLANQTVVWGALIALSVFASLSKGRKGLGEPVRLAELVTLAAPAAFMVLALFWLPADRRRTYAELGPPLQALGCFSVGLLVLAPLLAIAIWSVRWAFPTGAGWRGAALGAACGLGAALILTLHCSVPFVGHVALAHGAPLLLGAVLGGVTGAKLGRI
ncbi:MAG TPA: NrsF family protein [Polyangiaceae bacterium]